MVVTVNVLEGEENADTVAAYFIGLTHDRYYTEGGERPGEWYGQGAQRLGLLGRVTQEQFVRLLAGEAVDGRRLLKKSKKQKVPGYDVCFSVPKEVSILWANSVDATRLVIQRGFDLSIKRTLDFAENTIPFIRRGKEGCVEELGKLIIAMFDHTTSRVSGENQRVEPQLHRHCLVMNVAETLDGSYQSVNSLKLHYWARTLGPIFRANLAAYLRSELGIESYRPVRSDGTPESWFAIKDIPQALVDHWSSRRHELLFLLEGLAEFGITTHPNSAGAKQWANLQTRQSKNAVPPLSELFEQWGEVAASFGFTREQAHALLARVGPVEDSESKFQEAWKIAIFNLTHNQAYFTERHLIRAVTEELQATGVDGVWAATRTMEQLRRDAAIIPLAFEKREACFTTPEVWKLEEKLLHQIETLRNAAGAKVSIKTIEQSIAAHSTISTDQAEAVKTLLEDQSGLRLLSGVAGAGKSFAMTVIREALEASGYRVLGAALSGVAKEELENASGIPSRTVASYLYQWDQTVPENFTKAVIEPSDQTSPAANSAQPKPRSIFDLDPKSVLIVDEAGMLGTRDVERLTRHAADNGATVILVGDAKQLQPITSGGPFGHLLGKVDPARLTENRRQRNPLDAEAVFDLRMGDAEKAILNYAARDRLTVGENRADTFKKLVSEWSNNGGREQPKDHQIFTLTRAEAQAVNQLCQRERLLLGGFQNLTSIRHEEQLLVVGDRVLFHKNSQTDGVRNGYRGEITAIDRLTERVTIRLDSSNGESKSVVIGLRSYSMSDLTLGYACTTHKGQGSTVEHAYLLLGGSMTDRESAYVQASRGKETTRLFVDQASLGDDWKPLIDALNRTNPKKMAHDLGQETFPSKKQELPELTLERRLNQ